MKEIIIFGLWTNWLYLVNSILILVTGTVEIFYLVFRIENKKPATDKERLIKIDQFLNHCLIDE